MTTAANSNPIVSSTPRRAQALDALRGFAILTMVLSGVIPFGVLPGWMYHAQVPPPDHVFNPAIPGITWVDLVFPFFLFSMGAAFPLALSRRLEKGTPLWKLILGILERGVLLGAFAIFVAHIRPYGIEPNPTQKTFLFGLIAFILLFPMYARMPSHWNPGLRWGLRILGWGGAVGLMALVRFPDGSGFSKGRSDIIIVVLTNIAVFGSLLWLLTRRNLLHRLAILAVFMGIRLAGNEPGWVNVVYEWSPIPWMYRMGYLKYLFIAIPGSIAGDFLLDWMKSSSSAPSEKPGWSSGRYAALAGLTFLFVPVLLVGLYARWVPQTLGVCAVMSVLGFRLLRQPENEDERFLARLFGWGAFWLFLGFVFEPFEGGIKKDSSTMSYYFITSGLAFFLLMAFTIVGDIKGRKRWLGLLADNGQNPMIAYVGAATFILPVFALTGLREVYDWVFTGHGPWVGFLGGCFVTLLVALAVSGFTRLKIFWRT